MLYRLAAGLFGIAADFTHKYAPYQAVQVGPHPDGGAYICSTDRGNTAFFAHDPDGLAPEVVNFLPDKEITKAARFIKTAERTLEINLRTQLATVTTHQKSSNKVVEFRAPLVSEIFSSMAAAMLPHCEYWDEPSLRGGRSAVLDPALIKSAMTAAIELNTLRTDTQEGEAITFLALDSGALLVEIPGVRAAIVVMARKASALHGTPEWLDRLLQRAAGDL